MRTVNRYIRMLVVLVFLLSSTGIPLVIHTCKLMNKVTLISCTMMDMGRTLNNKNIKIINDCCSNRLVAGRLNSEFIIIGDHKIETANLGIVLPIFSTHILTEIRTINNLFYVNSPPNNYFSSVFITNHELLI
jgi:hypothetical protein